jgi:putative ABC transport system permease protein
MTNNFLKLLFRNLWKNRSYSFLNIFGLAIGIACAGLIFLWVEDEVSYDQWIPRKDRLFYVETNQTNQGKTGTYWSTPVRLAPAIVKEIPGVAAACRVQNVKALFSLNEKAIYASGAYTDSAFFGLFDHKFIEGRVSADPSSIVLTATTARQFFGNTPAVGQVLKMDNKSVYRVSGVVADIPENSTLQLSWMIPFAAFYAANNGYGQLDNWQVNSTNTYVLLDRAADEARINEKLAKFLPAKDPKATAQCWLFSANDWHLRSHFEDGKQVGGVIDQVRMFVVVAWIVLLIACINFMNLATARSDKRAKEVGVRKVLGAQRGALIRQFLGEALALSFIAVILAVMLISLVLPAFSLLIGRPLNVRLYEPVHLVGLALIALICGVVAGSYPALYLSAFNPIFVFKGIRMRGSGAAYVRKGLVVIQFTISVVLIIATIIVYRQVNHILSRDMGYDRNSLVTINVRGQMVNRFSQIRQDLIRSGAAENAALNSFNTLTVGNNGNGMKWSGKDEKTDPLVSFREVTPGFLQTAGMQLAEGRNFREDLPAADSMHIIVTETLARMISKESAIGKQIWFDDNGPRWTVVGVTKDFIFGDMYGKPEPVVFLCDTSTAYLMYVRLKPGVPTPDALAKTEAVLKADNPGYPFEYSFVSDDFNALFRSEMLIRQLSRLFAVLAILISCLGLFGLSAYMAERRVKEIGIRKVLGASVSGLTGLLSREFLQLVVLSVLIAFPLAWVMMHQWLLQYAYRIGVEWWIFVVAGLLAVLIALVTVSAHSIRAALTNPARTLRSE